MTERKNAWRDPLRFAMNARPGKTGTAVLFAALIAAFYLIAAKLCSSMDGVAVIAACGTLGAAILTAFAWRALRGEDTPVIVLLCTAALAMLAVGAHLALLDVKPGRYT